MPLRIAADFSLYKYIDWRSNYNVFSERRTLLAAWCRSIENTVVTRQLQAQVFAGFQQLRYVQPVLPRYTRVAQTAETYVFGQPGDIEIDVPNLQVVELDTQDDLVREWFLVVMHPGYQRALVAREMTAPGTPHARRLFRGIITSESRQVELFSNALREGLGLGERA